MMSQFLEMAERVFLSAIVRVLYHFSSDINPERILVLRSSRLGDFICALPALNQLRKCYSTSRIVLLTLPSASRLMHGKEGDASWVKLPPEGVVDEVILFHRRDVFSIQGLLHLRQRIIAFNPTLTFIFPFVRESFLSRVKKVLFLRVLGAKSSLFGWRNGKGGSVIARQHQIFGPLNALQEQGIEVCLEKDIAFSIARDENAKAYVDEFLTQADLVGRAILAIFPGGTFEHKRWALENFVELSRRLLEKYPYPIIVVGGVGEEAFGRVLEKAHAHRVHNLIGRNTLAQTAEFLRRSLLFIGNDSGIAHLASAVGTTSITIFSSIEYPGVWEPWQSRELSVRAIVPCRYCRSVTRCPTGTFACTREISVDQVLERCARVLGS